MTLVHQEWHWLFSGFMVATVMLLLLLVGARFGVSATFRTLCSMSGGAKCADFFNFNWRAQRWNLTFVLGAVLGGFIATHFMGGDYVALSEATRTYFQAHGLAADGSLLPAEIFSAEHLDNLGNLLWLTVGGFLVGFGARYAGGCTSGHAITGLSELQIPSLVAVVGFFMGGLIVTHLILPHLLNLL